jgi:hypothetical protein
MLFSDPGLLPETVALATEELKRRDPALLEVITAFCHADQPDLKDSPYRGEHQWLITVKSCDTPPPAPPPSPMDYEYYM